MAVPEQIPVVNYVADGVVKKFDVPFEYDQQSDLHVYVDGVEPTIDKYFFADNAFNFYIAPTNGQGVKIKRITPKERDTDYNLHTNTVRPKALNTDFDRLWYVLQEVFSDVGGLSQAVQDEIIARIQGDEDLLNQLTAEISARMLGDEAVTEDLKNYVDQVIGAIINDPDFDGIDAKNVNDASGETQQQVNYNGGSKWHSRVGGYKENERVALTNGDIVKSTVDGNTNDPNVDMTGWRLADPSLNAQKLERDFISVWDFFTKSEGQAYNLAVLNGTPETFDSYRPTQAFLDHISQNYYSNAYFIGRFWVSNGLNLVSSNSNRTTNITGSPTITATTAIDTVFNIDYGQDFVWNGILKLRGTGDQVYTRRTCNHGLKIGGTSSRARFKGVVASNFKQTGIYAYAGSTLGDFGDVRVSNIASGYTSQPTYNLSSAFSNPVNSGSSGNTSQYTTITVSTLPPADLITECMVSIGGQPYYVQAIDRANSTLQIFPWLDLNNTETNLTYIFGAGVYMTSGDASVLRFSEIDATRCGVAVWHGSLYPPIIDALVTQYCGVGQILGIYPTRAMVGGQVNGYYCENNNIDLLKLTRSESIGFYISSQYAFNYAKVKYAGAPRDTNNALLSQYANLNGVTIADYNGLKSFEKYPRGFLASTLGINVTNLTSRYMIYSGNSKNINIGTPNLDVHNAYGYDSYTLVYVGTNGNAPTGTFTFNAPSGYTVNGQSSVSFSNFASTAVFHIIWQTSTNNFVVSCSGQQAVTKATSVTYDPPSIASGATETTTVTLAGALVGDIVQAAFNKYSADIDITSVVSAANTVTVKFKNTGAAPVDLASGTLTVKLI